MTIAGYSVAPSDAHPLILEHASYSFQEKGGEGFVRAFIEKLLGIDLMSAEELIASNLL